MKQPTIDSDRHIALLNDGSRQRLRILREGLGLSRTKFADMLGIPPTTLKNYELNYRELGGGFLLLIAHHPELKQYTGWLMTGEGTAPVTLAMAA
ncbi:helix-turn-helix domain-containing protein [Aeromonas diversa]|uniref:helix-turn-helix domain-containing protein n=1 Tax=Aeromonas diversa TaxID=502790 RepID=UPI0039A094F9